MRVSRNAFAPWPLWGCGVCLWLACCQPVLAQTAATPEAMVAPAANAGAGVLPELANPSILPPPSKAKPEQNQPTPSVAWLTLTPLQKQALAPLGAQWGALTARQQNKWLAISRNFSQLSVAEQITLHSRMAEWVDLSPQQRNLARLNFNKLQSLPKEDKKAQWEAYQALSAEEKRQLSGQTISPPKSAAPSAKPVPSHRQVQTPARVETGQPAPIKPIDKKTLLPLPLVPPAPPMPTQ